MDAVTIAWRKSSYSGGSGGGCVEVATLPDRVMVRDSKDPDGPRLAVYRREWMAFLTAVRATEHSA